MYMCIYIYIYCIYKSNMFKIVRCLKSCLKLTLKSLVCHASTARAQQKNCFIHPAKCHKSEAVVATSEKIIEVHKYMLEAHPIARCRAEIGIRMRSPTANQCKNASPAVQSRPSTIAMTD